MYHSRKYPTTNADGPRRTGYITEIEEAFFFICFLNINRQYVWEYFWNIILGR